MWVPPEDHDPMVLQEPTRRGISVFGSVDPGSGVLHTRITEKYNTLTFREFLMSTSPVKSGAHLILDNARYHHASLLKELLDQNTNIMLEFLPPYSPDLNPIESVWKLIRKSGTHNRYFPDMGELIFSLSEQFNRYAIPNEALRRPYAMN